LAARRHVEAHGGRVEQRRACGGGCCALHVVTYGDWTQSEPKLACASCGFGLWWQRGELQLWRVVAIVGPASMQEAPLPSSCWLAAIMVASAPLLGWWGLCGFLPL
jgi:hypothetical protein